MTSPCVGGVSDVFVSTGSVSCSGAGVVVVADCSDASPCLGVCSSDAAEYCGCALAWGVLSVSYISLESVPSDTVASSSLSRCGV